MVKKTKKSKTEVKLVLPKDNVPVKVDNPVIENKNVSNEDYKMQLKIVQDELDLILEQYAKQKEEVNNLKNEVVYLNKQVKEHMSKTLALDLDIQRSIEALKISEMERERLQKLNNESWLNKIKNNYTTFINVLNWFKKYKK